MTAHDSEDVDRPMRSREATGGRADEGADANEGQGGTRRTKVVAPGMLPSPRADGKPKHQGGSLTKRPVV